MPNEGASLRNLAVAAIVAAVLSLPALSAAQADQQADATLHAQKSTAKTQRPKQSETEARPRVYYAAPNPTRCTWPYQNQFPPCQSTWPAGSPNYHGSRPGPTFFDEE
jgi:hypothetical protein